MKKIFTLIAIMMMVTCSVFAGNTRTVTIKYINASDYEGWTIYSWGLNAEEYTDTDVQDIVGDLCSETEKDKQFNKNKFSPNTWEAFYKQYYFDEEYLEECFKISNGEGTLTEPWGIPTQSDVYNLIVAYENMPVCGSKYKAFRYSGTIDANDVVTVDMSKLTADAEGTLMSDATGISSVTAGEAAAKKVCKTIQNGKLVIVNGNMKFNAAGQRVE